jgi:8-oxo-dGTP pyrophosphatase MutT (NUDIX family)
VIDKDQRIFLVTHTYVPGWQLPGGGVEPGETMAEALARELMEEGNIEILEPPVLHGLFFNSRVFVGANVAETAILDFDACFPDSVIGLIVDTRLADNEYVEFLLQTFKAILKQRGKGTARDNINLATFENQTFPFPDVAEQRQIVARINDLAEQSQRLESLYQQKLDSLAELKQAILQKAFAGELTAQLEQFLQEAVA